MSAMASLNTLDPRSFGELQRLAAKGDSPEALRAAAQQFESVFMQMVFKAMREATPQGGLFDSEHTRMFQSMHDQQLASDLASRGNGMGLADAIFRQLGGEAMQAAQEHGHIGPDGRRYFDLSNVARPPAMQVIPRPANPAADVPAAENAAVPTADVAAAQAAAKVPEHVAGFVRKLRGEAEQAGRELGVPAHFLVAQAALETGWGRAELRRADGSTSHNLFNIKAGSGWKGDTVELPVTEYANGRAYTENARFRAYGSYAEAFRDYVSLLRDNPRYAEALGQQQPTDFAQGLARGGYATDPQYADKLVRIIGGDTLGVAWQGATQLASSAR
ncbi:MAG: flagellar assembly peptidoglycan hydrolase FlgJ [Pseudazoarcus pumilus]|nr:flagellar assembly peptidoglycan hydrolase FlgJ [Pseudazoarcus pumilus]